MQQCIECGWDTRSGSRLCSACRTSRPDAGGTDETTTVHPASEKEALLTAVLRSARSSEPSADERTHADDESTSRDDDHGTHDDRAPSSDRESGTHDDVVARELDGGDNEIDLTGDIPQVHHTDPPPVVEHDRPAAAVPDELDHHRTAALDHGSTDFGGFDDDIVPPAPARGRGNTTEAAAFDDPTSWDHDTTTDDPSVPPATRAPAGDPTVNGRGTTSGNDTADDLAALFNTPSPWDDDAQPPGEQDTSDELADLFNRPGPWNREPAPSDEPTGPESDERHDTIPPAIRERSTGDDLAGVFGPSGSWDRDDTRPPSERWAQDQPGLDDAGRGLEGPAPYPEAETAQTPDDVLDDTAGFIRYTEDPVDVPAADVDFGAAESRETDNRSTKYSPEEWPWVGKTGDGGFWAPPPNGAGYAGQPRQVQGPESATYDELVGIAHDDADSGPISGPIRQPGAATPDDPPPAPAPAGAEPQKKAGTVRRWFHDLGGWTAIAQVALLAVGMLCIIQVFVLVVVTSYLDDGGDTAGSLAAHAKVDGVMLPALFAFAAVALLFAAWRGFDRGTDDSSLRRPLGFPLGLWAVLASLLVLLAVIIMSTAPADVAEARRVTQLAMVACTLLGIACFVAPRGLEEPIDDEV
jgi:hypothetical protein